MKSGQLWIVQLAELIADRAAAIVSGWATTDKEHPGDQLRRATDSIGSNIVEGYARHHQKDRMRFYSMARGSIEESLYYVRRARNRKLISEGTAINLSGSLFRLADSFTKFIQNQRPTLEAETPKGGDTEHR